MGSFGRGRDPASFYDVPRPDGGSAIHRSQGWKALAWFSLRSKGKPEGMQLQRHFRRHRAQVRKATPGLESPGYSFSIRPYYAVLLRLDALGYALPD